MIEKQPVEAYPLCWPPHRKRTAYRQSAAFKTGFAKARDHIVSEVRRLGGSATIISTNIELKRDGLPYATFRTPEDTAVALYFTYKGKQMCFACDRYRKVEDNMHAISLTISALRGIARWGTGDMMEAAFSGFTALPAPGQTQARGWREVLEAAQGDSLEDVKTKYRKLSSMRHPDKGGSADAMSELNWAWNQAQEALK
jgi:hypothetical protein